MRKGRRSVFLQQWSLLILALFTALFLFAACEVMDQRPNNPTGQRSPGSSQWTQTGNSTIRARESESKGFFPLDIGNRWTYTGKVSLEVGEGSAVVFHTEEEHTIVGTEILFGREYILEKQEIVVNTRDAMFTYWVRYRQDRAGLYEADVPILEPPSAGEDGGAYTDLKVDIRRSQWAILWQRISTKIRPENQDAYQQAWDRLFQKLRVIDEVLGRQTLGIRMLIGPPGGVLPDEITRLRYPLHPRQEWIIREDPFMTSIVEGHEVLDLAPGKMGGFKIRVLNAALGPDDIILFWYGKEGFLKLFTHVEDEAVDPEGNPIDTLVSEHSLILESLDLVQPGRRL